MTHKHPLRREREQRGWSQAKLAELLGTSPLSISQWERGVYLPSPHFREKLCTLFERDAQSLGLLTEETPKEHLSIHDPFLPLQALPASGLIGREGLLLSLIESLNTKSSLSAMTLHGLPGVGKTALLLALTQHKQIQQHFSDGILWAGLGPQPHLFEHLHRWGTLLHIPEEEMKDLYDLSSWAKSLRSHIGTRKLLLILDDVWSVEHALALQVGGEQCVHVVTTRLPSLALHFGFQNTVHIPELEDIQGTELLAHYLPHVAQQEPETLHDLIREAGTLPLALTLIGKHLSRYDALDSPRRLHIALNNLRNLSTRLQLSQPQSLVDHHPSLSPEQPLSLEVIIAVSEHQLSPAAQTALRQVALLPAKPNSFSEDLVTALIPTSLEVFDELVDGGLVEWYGVGRYTLHQTIADYAHSHTQLEDGEQEQAIQRLVDYYVGWLELHTQAYEQIEQEQVNLLTVLELASTHTRNAELVRLVLAFVPFWQVRGWYEQAEQYLQRALLAVQELSDNKGRITVLKHLETLEERRGNYEQAKMYCREALELAQQEGYQEQRSQLLSDLGMLELRQGNYERAEQYCGEALALARQEGHLRQVIFILRDLGGIMYNQANYAQALKYSQEGLDLARQRGDSEQISLLLNNLASIMAERQETQEQARIYHQEGLELARQLGHREYIIRHLNGLGVLAVRRADNEQALLYFQEALEQARQLDHRSIICNLLNNLADTSTRLGKYEQAEAYLQEGLELAWRIGNVLMITMTLESLGELRLLQQQIDSAEASFREVLQYVPKESRDLCAYAHYGLAQVAAARKQFDEALAQGRESLTIFEQIDHYMVPDLQRWIGQILVLDPNA